MLGLMLGLRVRLIAGYLLPICAMIIIGMVGGYAGQLLQAQFENLTQDTIPSVQALQEAKIAGLRIVSSINEFALLGKLEGDNKEQLAEEIILIQEGIQLYDSVIARYGSLVDVDSAVEPIFLAGIKLSGQNLIQESNKILHLIQKGASASEILAAKEELEADEQAFLSALDEALSYEADSELIENQTHLEKTIRNTTLFVAGAAGVTILMVVIFSFLILRSIVRPLQKLRDAAQEIGRGHFAVQVDVPSRDKLGELARAFNQMAAAVRDHANKLDAQKQELERSNGELQQFAYVASHDLQEPLRMVVNYLQLLKRRYKDRLDQDANDFIHFSVDGAIRMQELIKGLLAYSRVETQRKPHQSTSCQAILEQVQANLYMAIEESNTRITHDPLPTVLADPTQLAQLLQNLIGNAIKFSGTHQPEIHIAARQHQPENPNEVCNQWVFSVRDNGIGMESQYFERIFQLFQRLHTRDEYDGTGLGLAICKRIVERHGGRIWVESTLGKGSTFYFSLLAP